MPCEVSPPEGNPRDANGGVDPVGEGPRPGAGQDAALPLLHENGSGRALCVPPRGHGSGNGQAETGPSLPLLLSARKRGSLPAGFVFLLRAAPPVRRGPRRAYGERIRNRLRPGFRRGRPRRRGLPGSFRTARTCRLPGTGFLRRGRFRPQRRRGVLPDRSLVYRPVPVPGRELGDRLGPVRGLPAVPGCGDPVRPPPPRVRHRHRGRRDRARPLDPGPFLPGLPPHAAVAHLPRGGMSFCPIPRSTISLRRTISVSPFADPSTSNFPVSPRRSAPSPPPPPSTRSEGFCPPFTR